ncbi:hypothetical protein BCEN4_1200023 [Burkholderia cenocepacia]|nr:hypothetical protein BCEN4_1200023 [Burkholderia cenocepacia]
MVGGHDASPCVGPRWRVGATRVLGKAGMLVWMLPPASIVTRLIQSAFNVSLSNVMIIAGSTVRSVRICPNGRGNGGEALEAGVATMTSFDRAANLVYFLIRWRAFDPTETVCSVLEPGSTA